MKIIAVTQARYGSTRLQGKVLKEIQGMTLLDIHLERILQSKKITKLKIATTNEDKAEKIIEIATKHHIETYKGSIDDVLERFYFCLKNEKPDYVVRITSDCPLIDPMIIDKVISVCLSSDYDYVSNTLIPTYPDGMDVEVFKFSALEKAYNEATLKSDREHVTPYIWRNSSVKGGKLFSSFNVANKYDYSNYRLTVDTLEDFQVIRALIESNGINKGWKEYINFLDKNPNIKNLNINNVRNEGYQKSLLND
jgi:spore coat polysaccharide biosynthesis protein SpsF (cytidylyltransferase family)